MNVLFHFTTNSARYALVLSCLLLSSCSSYQPFYNKTSQNWESVKPTDEVKYTVYLVGDAGAPDTTTQPPVLKLLQSELEKATKNSAVVFLGNNVYDYGMPPEEDEKGRADAERKLGESLKILKDFKGRPLFIPGHHDWNNANRGGLRNIQEQADYIETYLGRDDVFYPENGCAGPVDIKLADDVVLLIIDSEWWLYDEDREPGINEDCDFKNEEEFLLEMDDILKKSQQKKRNVIVASHHPLFSNGNHGGYFSYKDHLFPLTNLAKWLYLPLPFVGSLYPAARRTVGSVQDLPNPRYRAFRTAMMKLTKDHDNLVFASGHEHSLQYFKKEKKHFIVSGAGSRAGYTRKGAGAEFTYSHQGFSKLLYCKDGSVWMEMWVPVDDGTRGMRVYSTQIKEANPTIAEIVEEKQPEFTIKDSVVTTKASNIYRAGKFKRFWLGDHYRDAWLTNISVPVLDLGKEHGGLLPDKRGGGMQTKSLRLLAPDGKEYTLRSIQKDASLVLPDFVKKTFVQNVVQDGVSAAHPYAAVVVPPLADAAGVYHTNPKIVYLPHQKNLGNYNEVFGGEMYIYEERLDGNLSHVASVGNPKEVLSTPDLLVELNKDHDRLVDQKSVIRARLFDILLNDWDRHDDQWRWASFKEDKKTVYRPIPRDRDQVFFKFEGTLPWVATRKMFMPTLQLQNFSEKVYNIRGVTFNARYFDRSFLIDLELNEWLAAVDELKKNLTDEVIENAIRTWPDSIFQLNGEEVIRKLKGRRDLMTDIATKYYKVLAKNVEVIGTRDREYFKVERLNNEDTKVTVYGMSKKGNLKDILFERTFHRKETKEIRLFGKKDEDKFELTGKAKRGIKIRIVGGGGEDSIIDHSRVAGLRRLTKVYDKKKSVTIERSGETHNKTSNAKDVNDYDRLAFKYNRYMPFAYVGYNFDEEVFIGAGANIVDQGFRKYPYASSHSVSGRFTFATKAFDFKYNGDFVHVFRKMDIDIDFYITGPNFTVNFFGLGNETIENDSTGKRYNYVRKKQAELFPGFRRVVNQIHTFKFGPVYQFTENDSATGRFVASPEAGLADDDFKDKFYGGVATSYTVNKVDDPVFPKYGYRFSLDASWMCNLAQAEDNFVKLRSQISVYYTFDFKLPLTIAIRAGGGTNIGEYEFFQGHTLGGNTNLRGFRNDRFAGKANFYNNAELRWKFLEFRTVVLPASVGILGFFDHGRVWYENEHSHKWHYGYGGGVWISPYKMLVISANYTRSEEDDFFLMNFKFLF